MIVVLATIELNPGTRDPFLAEFRDNLAAVRAEEGCIEYFPAIDVGTALSAQKPTRSDVVVVVEKWESVAALEAHLIAPHMVAYRNKVKDYVKGTTLQILEPAG